MIGNYVDDSYYKDPPLRSLFYYTSLFSVGFLPGLLVGYLIWG